MKLSTVWWLPKRFLWKSSKLFWKNLIRNLRNL